MNLEALRTASADGCSGRAGPACWSTPEFWASSTPTFWYRSAVWSTVMAGVAVLSAGPIGSLWAAASQAFTPRRSGRGVVLPNVHDDPLLAYLVAKLTVARARWPHWAIWRSAMTSAACNLVLRPTPMNSIEESGSNSGIRPPLAS